MKEDLDLIIEYKLIKRYEFDTFISDIEKYPFLMKILHSTRGITLLTCIRPSLISNMGNGSRSSYHFQYKSHHQLPLPLTDDCVESDKRSIERQENAER